MKSRTGEVRVIVQGLAVLMVVAGLFAAGKLAFWRSTVVHEEKSSIHRVFPGGTVLRFPQESPNAADILTGGFLALAGATALGLSFSMGERLRARRVTSVRDAQVVRTFFALAGVGLLWLGFDEIFLAHEFLSANLYVSDSLILLAYAAAGGVAAVVWQRVLRASRPALAVMTFGALLHAASLGLDFVQDSIGWAPEEPLEMLAAGLYALGMATYFVRLVLTGGALAPAQLPAMPASPRVAVAGPAAEGPGKRPAELTSVVELPDGAIQPLEPPNGRLPSDPAWTR